MKQLLTVSALLAYLFFRIISPHWVDSLFPDAGLIFDLTFAAGATWHFRARFFVAPLSRQIFSIALLSFLSGCITAAVAQGLKLEIPFNLFDTYTLLLLLIGGPILEELIFRFSLWELIPEVKGFGVLWRERLSLGLTTLFFAAAHFTALQYVSEGLQSFVLFQTGYTLILGYVCGRSRISTRALGTPIVIHMLFNLGFFAIARGLSV
jgi:membrane protease YdiL (CAAX protease family)